MHIQVAKTVAVASTSSELRRGTCIDFFFEEEKNMQIDPSFESPFADDPDEQLRLEEELYEKREEFMRKHLRRVWPIRILRLLGIFQLLISLAILGVDLPIILMFGPRWQIFAGCWTFVMGLIACISTIHSTRKMTWQKLRWAIWLNSLAGIAAALMVAFDILFLTNPYICIIISGCNYLSYTYSPVQPYLTSQVILGIALFVTVFIFAILFVKYGIGGTTIFENIQMGWMPASHAPMMQPNTGMPMMQPHPGMPMMQPNTRMPMMQPNPGMPMMQPNPGMPMMQPNPGMRMMQPNPGMPMANYPATGAGVMMMEPPRPPMMPRPPYPRMPMPYAPGYGYPPGYGQRPY